jgi:hypothetical protein
VLFVCFIILYQVYILHISWLVLCIGYLARVLSRLFCSYFVVIPPRIQNIWTNSAGKSALTQPQQLIRMNPYEIGPFSIYISAVINPLIEVSLISDPSQILWKTTGNGPFIRAAYGTSTPPPNNNGNYQVEETVESHTEELSIDPTSISVSRSNDELSFAGQLNKVGNDYDFYFSFSLVPSSHGLTEDQYQLNFNFNITTIEEDPINRVYLTYWCESDENFYGFGESFTYFNLNGRNVPILVSEQGLGRGLEPITSYYNDNQNTTGAGGYW